ncbi:MAG: hypothetical protein AAF363_14775 [Bacteroidota bacterium]
MNPLFFIPVIVIGVGVAFMIYMNKKHQSAKEEIDIDQERLKYERYKSELLEHDFSKIVRWLKGKPVDAFTSASVSQSTLDKVVNLIGDGFEDLALSAFKVKVTRVDADCFWVLSGTDLHFLSTDTDGKLEDHIIFDNFRLEEASLHYKGILKEGLGAYSKQADKYLPKAHTIVFNINGNQLPLEIHDRLKYIPSPTDLMDGNKSFFYKTKYQVVGERLIEILKSKYSNL